MEGHSDRVLYIDFYPNGEQIATASQDGTARIWDVESGQDSQRLEGHGKGIVGGVYEGGVWGASVGKFTVLLT